MKTAIERLRLIEWDAVSYDLMSSSTGNTDSYALSRPLRKGEKIDFFMSHSWHDDSKIKWQALNAFVGKFRAVEGRNPTFWLDKVCIDQDNIQDGLKAIPVYVMACKKMLILCGSTYPLRLWCAWELFTLFSFQGYEAAQARVELIPLINAESDKTITKGSRKLALSKVAEDKVLHDLQRFDVSLAHTYDPNEELTLRAVITAVGVAKFNKSIRDMADAIIQTHDRQNRCTSRPPRHVFSGKGQGAWFHSGG